MAEEIYGKKAKLAWIDFYYNPISEDPVLDWHCDTSYSGRKIVEKFIDQLEAQLEEKKITIELDNKAKLSLAKKGFDPVFGARPLARLIQDEIKKPLADKILFGDLSNGGHIKVTVKNDIFKFDISLNSKAKEKA